MTQIQEKIKNLMKTVSIIQSSPGINSAEIASILQISTRTVQRYIKQLRETGLIIDASSGHMGGFVCRSKGYKINPIYLTLEERTILTLAVNTFLNYEGFPFKKELNNLLEKISKNSNYSSEESTDYFSIMLPPRGNYQEIEKVLFEVKSVIAKRRH